MAMLNKEELRKLSLTERIKRLKEIEKESKKDIEEAEKLIKETKAEIRTSEIASDIGPEPERVEISSLFKKEETLEGAVGGEAPRKEEEEKAGAVEYVTKLEERTEAEIYQTPRQQAVVKIEEQVTYKTTSKDAAEKSVASRSVTEDSKKYTKG